MKLPKFSRLNNRSQQSEEDVNKLNSNPNGVTRLSFGRGIKHNRKLLIVLVLVVAALVLGASIGIDKYANKEEANETHKKAPIIIVDGQEYSADYLLHPPDDSKFTKETPTLDQYIHEGEEAIALGRADYEVFVTLASMYGTRGDIDKALSTYKRAKDSVDKADPEYEGKIKAVDQNIADLNAEGTR